MSNYIGRFKEKFVKFYADTAASASELSRGKRLKVGSIAVKGNSIVSYGYNGLPPGDDSPLEYREYDNKKFTAGDIIYADELTGEIYVLRTKSEVIHAEDNMIIKLNKEGKTLDHCDVFITHAPCINCAKLMVKNNVGSVYYSNDYRSNDGVEFLKKNNIGVYKI